MNSSILVNPQHSLFKSPIKHSQKLPTSQTLYHQLLLSTIQSFEKPYEHRNPIELTFITKLTQNINFFRAVQTLASPEALRSLLKYGKVVKVSEHKLLYEEGNSLDSFVIGLMGRFGVVGQAQIAHIKDQQGCSEYLDQFKNFSSKHLQYIKKKQLCQPSPFRPTKIDPSQLNITTELTAALDTELIFVPKSNFLLPNQQKKSQITLLTLSPESYLFEIDFKKICEIMRQQYNKTVLRRLEIFTGFGCFRLFKKEKLRLMVEEMQLKQYQKGEIIFREGNHDARMFVLVSGQVQMERLALIGSQNPNTLYKNRFSLKRSLHNSRAGDNIVVIPFADFSKLYNASSQLKKVKLTRLSPISIFGEQQILGQTTRQTTARVTSLNAEMYVFTLDEIGRYFTADSQYKGDDFLRVLAGDISEKKMLYRQEKLGGEVEWLGKSLKGGFYVQGEGPFSTKGKRRLMEGTNRTIPARIVPNTVEIDNDSKMFLTATFNCHNFEQFYESHQPKSSSKKSLQLTNPPSPKSQSRCYPLSKQQKQILKLLHGNQRTIMKSSSKVRSSRGHFAIDLEKPLFTPEYFRLQLERSRRVDKEAKRTKLNKLYQSSQGLCMGNFRNSSSSGVKSKGNVSVTGVRRNLSYHV